MQLSLYHDFIGTAKFHEQRKLNTFDFVIIVHFPSNICFGNAGGCLNKNEAAPLVHCLANNYNTSFLVGRIISTSLCGRGIT